MERKVTVEEITEVYCDFCPKMISDGLHDGLGGINFWGVVLALREGPFEFTVKAEKAIASAAQLTITHSWLPGDKRFEVVLCKSCADEVKAYLKSKMRGENDE